MQGGEGAPPLGANANTNTGEDALQPKPSLQNGAETFRTLRTGCPEMFGKEISRWFWDLDHHGEIASRKKIPTLRTGLIR